MIMGSGLTVGSRMANGSGKNACGLARSSGRGSILRSRPGARGSIRYTALSVDLVRLNG